METTIQKEAVIKRFDRHAQMGDRTRGMVMELISDIIYIDDEDRDNFYDLKNWLSGLFDGYYYETYIEESILKLREAGYKALSRKVEWTIEIIQKYEFSA